MPGHPAIRWTLVGVFTTALIVVPFALFETRFSDSSQAFLSSTTSRGIVAAAAAGLLASDVLLPVPSSFVSAFAVGALGPVLGAVSVWTGMTAGALIGYAVGHGGGRPLVARVVGPSELARADRLFARYGKGVLVVCRGVPVLAEASVLLAGAARMPLVGFAWVTSAAHVGLALAYALVTSFGAEGAWAMLAPFALGIAVPALAILVLKRVERRAPARSLPPPPNDCY
jgi:uncharacterized membrane protein YdjX (TVP38/TMEM64 family)